MGKYYIHENGVLRQTGACPDGEELNQGAAGTTVELGEPPEHIKWPESPPLPYTIKRVQAYPSIGDQLDALFKAGVFPPEMAAKIQAVKAQYPKT